MSAFQYRNGVLHAEDVSLDAIARVVGTPFYCYSSQALEQRLDALKRAFAGSDSKICYAVKANSNLAVLTTLARAGAGADVVSEGEIRLALKAGVAPEDMVFAGVGKQDQEMALALKIGVSQFNVESEAELTALSAVASGMGKVASIAIRVNPDVDAGTHAKIATGHAETKFGIPWRRARDIYAFAARLPGIRVVGVHVHIGSQLTSLAPFEAAFRRVAELVTALKSDGHPIDRIDLGGGLGISYDEETPPEPGAYGAMARQITHNLGCKLILEPGRFLVGNAGILVSRVIYTKKAEEKGFVIIDAAMNDLIRPTLYEAYHRIAPVQEAGADAHLGPYDVVGPVCETGDILGEDRLLPPLANGELLAIFSAGAYGSVMASTYNARPLVPEVMVKGDRFEVVRRRQTYEEMTRLEALPSWLAVQGSD